MHINELHNFLQAEFGRVLKSEARDDGHAYFWHEIKRAPTSTRLLRVSANPAGEVREIKLAQTSIAEREDVMLPLPASPEQVAAAVRTELQGLFARLCPSTTAGPVDHAARQNLSISALN